VTEVNYINGHPSRDEDFDLFALGALDADERRAFESHLASCAACKEKLASARGRMAILALAAPPTENSPAVKQRLMRQVHADATSGTASNAPAPGAPAHYSAEPHPPARWFGRWWAAVLLPAAAGLAFASVYLWVQNQRLDVDLARLRITMEQQQDQLQQEVQRQEQLREQYQDAREVAELMAARDTMIVPLTSQRGMPHGSARVVYNSQMGMLYYDGVLDAPPAHKSYQLWLVPKDGDPISAGVFNPVSGQDTHWMMKLPKGLDPKAFAVTLEPSGGMSHPTGPKVLLGAVS
jgi:anti-sigma-K factor RskA